MAWTEADIPSLTGRVAVVTGANGGLGLATARALAGKGAHVVMAARDQDKAASARDEIVQAHPDASLEIVPLDLGSLASIGTATEAILAAHERIDILVNNAGLMAMPDQTTEDGFEMQFGVNHLGHWALTAKLLPAILRADAARVVTVSSIARLNARPVDPDDVHMRTGYDAWKAYGQSKLANYHFALGLHRELASRGLGAASLVAHPGLTHSDLQVRTAAEGGAGRQGAFWEWAAKTTGMSITKGARPQLRAATDPRAKSGELYGPRFGSNGPAVRLPLLRRGIERDVATLWEISERETGIALDVDAAANA